MKVKIRVDDITHCLTSSFTLRSAPAKVLGLAVGTIRFKKNLEICQQIYLVFCCNISTPKCSWTPTVRTGHQHCVVLLENFQIAVVHVTPGCRVILNDLFGFLLQERMCVCNHNVYVPTIHSISVWTCTPVLLLHYVRSHMQ